MEIVDISMYLHSKESEGRLCRLYNDNCVFTETVGKYMSFRTQNQYSTYVHVAVIRKRRMRPLFSITETFLKGLRSHSREMAGLIKFSPALLT